MSTHVRNTIRGYLWVAASASTSVTVLVVIATVRNAIWPSHGVLYFLPVR